MGLVFSTAATWTGDSRRDGQLRVVRLWLSMLGMTRVADKSNGITLLLLLLLVVVVVVVVVVIVVVVRHSIFGTFSC
jgi:hypothetical protein